MVTGLPRYDLPEADVRLIITSRDVLPLERAFERAQATVKQLASVRDCARKEGPFGQFG